MHLAGALLLALRTLLATATVATLGAPSHSLSGQPSPSRPLLLRLGDDNGSSLLVRERPRSVMATILSAPNGYTIESAFAPSVDEEKMVLGEGLPGAMAVDSRRVPIAIGPRGVAPAAVRWVRSSPLA